MSLTFELLGTEPELSPEELFREERWKNGVICPECVSDNVNRNGLRNDGVQQYKCKKCGLAFNDRTGTLFSKTQMSIGECLMIIKSYNSGKNISEISEEVQRSWKTVNDFIKIFNQSLSSEKISELAKSVEKDKVDYSKVGCGSSADFI